MKQVGLNVAADPLMTLAYIGRQGGLVLVVADDPGPHSSQTNRTPGICPLCQAPPSWTGNPGRGQEMMKYAFNLSEG